MIEGKEPWVTMGFMEMIEYRSLENSIEARWLSCGETTRAHFSLGLDLHNG